MATVAEIRDENKMLADILEWQQERDLESWNEDMLKGEIGLCLSEEHILSEDAPENEIEIVFESAETENEYTFKEFTLTEPAPGQYKLTQNADEG